MTGLTTSPPLHGLKGRELERSMSVTLTTDQAHRLIDELARIADVVCEFDAASLDGLRAELIEAMAIPPAYHTPAVPEITATTSQRNT